jgi:NAD-dependent deacetylase
MKTDSVLDDRVLRIAEILAGERRCVVLTGAGISVPSGIPDFRSAGGLWETFDPEVYATSRAWRSDPGKVWEMFRAVGKMLKAAAPNPAHIALGELESMGLVEAVVTQNIDGLHQAGGSKNVIEFHGNARLITCPHCGWKAAEEDETAMLDSAGLPLCPECREPVRPEVVLFGEPIPMEAMVRAMEAAAGCRSMLVVGTSGIVAPASSLPFEAKRGGAAVIEINLASTMLTSIADISVQGSAEIILPRIVEVLKRLPPLVKK